MKIPVRSPLQGSLESQLVKSQAIEQTMERLPNGVRRLAAQLRTNAKAESLWQLLTDYNHLSEFIPNLAVSELLSRTGNRVQLRQVGSQSLMGFRFSAQVHLELEENRSAGLLKFKLLKGDFRRFEGAWKISQSANKESICLLNELTVQGCIGMPVALIEQRLKEDLTANLLAVEQAASVSYTHLTLPTKA